MGTEPSAASAGHRAGAAPGAGVHAAGALPAGHELGEYRIEKVIGAGGFGIVYRALDRSLQRLVAIKEYMPAGLVTRTADHTLSLNSERERGAFEAGRRSFINEARLLARFDFPSLVRVFRFWEDNGTAYMAMPYYDGVTLRARLRGAVERPTELWLKRLLLPLLHTLECLHQENCFHRDIAPDNVMLLADDEPMLLDFGAARRVIGGITQHLTAILKPGFAPIEQYDSGESIQQGPWTDVYGVSATLFCAVTGQAPMSAVARAVHDVSPRAQDAARGGYTLPFLAAIDAGLAVNPERRPQTIAAFRDLLFEAGGRTAGKGPGSHRQRAPVTDEKLERVAVAALARDRAREAAQAPETDEARSDSGFSIWDRMRRALKR